MLSIIHIHNDNLPYLHRIAFSVKVLLLSLRVLLQLKFLKVKGCNFQEIEAKAEKYTVLKITIQKSLKI